MNQNDAHSDIARIELLRVIKEHHIAYANNWALHAAHNYEHGYYSWQCSFVADRKRILEIGVGDGTATLLLCQNGSNVIAIDPNPECLRLAEAKLRDAGIDVCLQTRESITIEADGYRTTYAPIYPEIGQPTAILLQGDIDAEEDPLLAQWLGSLTPFDAVICWMIGTHSARYQTIHGGPLNYRLLVQNRTYEIADKILCAGGILHFVDRGPAQDKQSYNIADELLASHQDQASITSLILDPDLLQSHAYLAPDPSTGITVGFRNQDGGVDLLSNMVLRSVIARKP